MTTDEMSRAIIDLTAEEARRVLDYDPDTGIFRWKIRMGQRGQVGSIAGSNGNRYLHIQIHGVKYKNHRLAWLITYGRWPNQHIDHINGDSYDNRLANLREATHAQNHQNVGIRATNTSGYVGVSWHKATQKWGATITHEGVQHHLGEFDKPEDAAAAYLDAKARLHTFQPVPRAA